MEILETQRSGLFKKGYVKIKVHPNKPEEDTGGPVFTEQGKKAPAKSAHQSKAVFGDPSPKNDFEKKMIDYIEVMIEKMGYENKVSVLFREGKKLGLKIDTYHSSIIIGKKGKNLDALQLIANIYAGRQGREDVRIILDTENYRIRREESLVRLAYNVADKVRENRGTILLEPMNPFDRRLIHTTLNDITDVETKSEGEGLYKQVRVYYRGIRQ